ncbi:undecaprenyldiphospho-muramoylpentapeptide beta-N-acetylglucosaminyltransferase [Anaeroselena agilis]|uniref:UDP-N-acetylglucosamine--N-acetylmuramyl-(pentapeptide) pyrophosphoryl-undecaprenol N-acetylglucosamine transferase n=1 Tax=Anaeroselena agilis TaxID=3063788 RepID=A0ABU3P0T3_9FIRM|nr:undecaprenyldiphospho-muramoylpentapeptide beta-N-acetylglucosaminyltransferase [Selenomonadales bacterium 4137-cl]
MRVIISGGGTGGHIYPALTIARAINEIEPSDILFVGTKQGLEADIVPKEGFPFATVDAGGIERRLTLGNLRALLKTFAGLLESFAVVRRFRPDVVIGTGGYVCGPVLLAASLLGIPAVIQEQNVIPGVTNRILARFVGRIAVGYAEAANNFGANRDKVVVTGNPVRPEILTATRESGLRDLGLSPGKLTVLVAGGSRGARSINTAMADVHARFAGREGIQILHATGSAEYNNIVGLLAERGIDVTKTGNISIVPYLYNMPQALAAADLAVFRAGAIGLAELTARGIPAILVPYPHAAENHQEFNARVLESRGAAVVIRDAALSGPRLADAIDALLGDRARLTAMAKASGELGRPEAAAAIARLAIDLAGGRPN